MPPSSTPPLRRRCLTALLALTACDLLATGTAPTEPRAEPRASATALGATAPTAVAPLPVDAPGILAELAPIPDGAVVIVYDVIGPGGMSGTLEVLAAAGGYRRDNWTISLPLPDGPREIRGSAVQTPTSSWRAEGETSGVVEPGRLGALADAIAKLDPALRIAVLTQLRSWQAELTLARAEDPGERENVAGIDCVRVRAGGGEVCTWEEAGLPMRYDGAAFSIVASHVERGAELGIHAFEIPADAARSPLLDTPGLDTPRDLAAALAKVAAGDRAELLRLVVVDSFPSLSAATPSAGAREG